MSTQASFLSRHEITVTAGSSREIPADGSLFVVKEASQFFDVQFDNRERMTVEELFQVNISPDTFQRVRIFATGSDDLKLICYTGRAGVSYNVLRFPPTKMTGNTVNLADGASQTFSGISSEGKRRKQITVTLRPSIAGHVRLYKGAELLAIVAASSSGGGFALETDDDIILTNATGGVISDTGATPDIAVAETFYR